MELLARRYLRRSAPRPQGACRLGRPAGAAVAPALESSTAATRAEDGTELLDLPAPPARSGDAGARALPADLGRDAAHPRPPVPGPARGAPDADLQLASTPHSFPVFLVDGVVAGTWRFEGGAVTTAPFESLGRADARDVAAEAERVAAFHR